MDRIKSMLEMKNWAVVGATDDKSKFGYKVFMKLMNHGYNVYPVNPKLTEIEGIKCSKSVTDISEGIDVISMIVNPKIGIGIIDEAFTLGIKNIWCQPGAESEELIAKAKEKGINILYHECVLVELG